MQGAPTHERPGAGRGSRHLRGRSALPREPRRRGTRGPPRRSQLPRARPCGGRSILRRPHCLAGARD